MKRTLLKRKTGLRQKTGLKKKGKQSISKLQREVWELCKQITRQQYGNICYTCDARDLAGSNWQTGHLLAKASLGAYLKYDLRLLRPQCFRCNINLGGMGAVFIENLRAREGTKYVEQILADRTITVRAHEHYLKLLEEYKQELKDLKK